VTDSGAFQPLALDVADVNNDGKLDVVVLNQGVDVDDFTHSLVQVFKGDGAGKLTPTGSLLQVPSFATSLVGGLADLDGTGIKRVVDFNGDGFPDFVVASTRGGGSTAWHRR